VKRAVLFGASAVIILALNPKVLQEVNYFTLLQRSMIKYQTRNW